MKKTIKDNSPEAEAMRQLARSIKSWPEPENAQLFDDRYTERLMDDPEFKPIGMSQSKAGTWVVRGYIGGRQWPMAYFHRELQWKAALVADIVNITLWPYRASFDGNKLPPEDSFNHRFDEVYGEIVEGNNSDFAQAVRKWQQALAELAQANEWGRLVGPDGAQPARRIRTVTDSFNNFRWQQEEHNLALAQQLDKIQARLDALTTPAVSPEVVVHAAGESAKNLFAMHHELDRKIDELANDVRMVQGAIVVTHQKLAAIYDLLQTHVKASADNFLAQDKHNSIIIQAVDATLRQVLGLVGWPKRALSSESEDEPYKVEELVKTPLNHACNQPVLPPFVQPPKSGLERNQQEKLWPRLPAENEGDTGGDNASV